MLAIKRGDQFFRRDGGEVHATVGEVGALLRVIAERFVRRLMAHVGGCHGERASVQRLAALCNAHCRIDVATQPTAADLQVTLRPGAGWQFQPKTDLRGQPTFNRTHRDALTGGFAGRQHATALPADVVEVHACQCSAAHDGFDHRKPGERVNGIRCQRFGLRWHLEKNRTGQ